MLDFIFSSTGPELQITLKIVRRHFLKLLIVFTSFILFFSKLNKTPLITGLSIRTWQETMRLVGTTQCCILSTKL